MSNAARTHVARDVAWPVFKILAWRACQILVVGPGTIVALLLFIAALAGEEPIRGLVAANYEWADKAFRSAPEGMVLDGDGSEIRKQLDAGPKHLQREPVPLHPVPIAKAIDETSQWLRDAYLILVSFGAIFLLALSGPFGFFGLQGLKAHGAQQGEAGTGGVEALRGERRRDE